MAETPARAFTDWTGFHKQLSQREPDRPPAPVLTPCHWPDAPVALSQDGQDASTSSPSESFTPIEYGVLSVRLWQVRTRLDKRWRPFIVLDIDGHQAHFETAKLSPQDWRDDTLWALLGRAELRLQLSTYEKRSYEVTLHLLFRNFDTSLTTKDGDVMYLGALNLGRSTDFCAGTRQDFQFQDGTATVDLEITFSPENLQTMLKRRSWEAMTVEIADLAFSQEIDTRDLYLVSTIPSGDYRHGSATRSLHSPLWAPVRFAYESPGLIHLLSPLPNGGPLFSEVQRTRRLPIERARLCAAQLVSALEDLHSMGTTALLNPENVFLDPFGNIRICTPTLFAVSKPHTSQLECPPPEILRGDDIETAGDWWILGTLLYEMLTGLPPFYDSNVSERNRKILQAPLDFPAYLDNPAVNILRRLLRKHPEDRLGVVLGVSEIRKHEFFRGLDWQDLIAKKAQFQSSPFIPPPELLLNIFRSPFTPSPPPKPEEYIETNGFLDKVFDFGPFLGGRIPYAQVRSPSEICSAVLPEMSEEPSLAENETPHGQGDDSNSGSVKARLKHALYQGWDTQAIAQILENQTVGVTDLLNSRIVKVRQAPITVILPHLEERERADITPLEWAVELGQLDLVRLFFDHGADPDKTYDEVDGPGLKRATRRRDLALVEFLAPRTSRIFCIRALCLAVELSDTAIVKALFAQEVPCDFEEADRLLPAPSRPPSPWEYQCGYNDFSSPKPCHHLSPLVRAARQGDAAMVRLLLDNGADANAAYHSLHSLVPDFNSSWQERLDLIDKRGHDLGSPVPRCGRVVQLAMGLGYQDVVMVLLAGGANIDLPHPQWNMPYHICSIARRRRYLEITAGVEDARRAMMQDTAMGKWAEA